MNRTLTVTVLAAAMLLVGCKTNAVDPEYPARIIDPNDASRASLQAAVNAAMHREVLLAEDALTKTSVLAIERRPAGGIGKPDTQGRITEVPIQLHLVSNGTDCILVDPRDDSRRVLENTSCVAIDE